MALRTFRIMGQAYASTGDVSVVAEFDGVTVHDGIVPTTSSVEPSQNTARDVMIEFNVADTLYNNVVPSSFAVSGGVFIIAGIMANNTKSDNLAEFNYLWQTANQSPSKTNISLDGILVDIIEAYGWHYRVPDGSTMTIDWRLPEPPLGTDLPGHIKITADLCVVGKEYRIRNAGTTDFTTMGAADNLPNTVFVCTATGAGTGTSHPTGK